MLGLLALVGYAATIVLANWSIGHLGWCLQSGPCTIPVAPGLWAPSGVLWVGLALALRDAVQDLLGRRWTITGIIIGALLSYFVETPALAIASAAAFLLSEVADFLVYTPLRESGRHSAGVFFSGIVGSTIDSAVFLSLAGISLSFLLAQVVGKLEITVVCTVIVWLLHKRHQAGFVPTHYQGIPE